MTQNALDNSQFKIVYREDGVYIAVIPSKITDKGALMTQILERVNFKKIRNVDRRAVQTAIETANGEYFKIAEKQEEVKINASINVIIAPDKMSASFVMTPPDGGSILTPEQILSQAQAKGVKSGIDMAVIYKVATNPIYNENVKFAEGTTAIKGEDGKIEILFDMSGNRKPRILEDGSVDFREINFINSVQKGQVLANIIPPKPGIDGKNVLGMVLPAPKGKPIPNAVGKNVELVNNTIVANIDGYASFIDNKVSVMTILDIPGNVDISTGNIRFNGSVIIRGNVLTDFIVEATGDVEVNGVVEGATIKADGDIVLKRGIQGLNKGVLISGNDIVARYIEHCTVTAKNDIKCEAVMHSTLKCGGVLELGGRKGLIVGGTIKVGKEINAKYIGSPMSTLTDIEVGADPTLRDEYKGKKEKLTSFQIELDRSEKSIQVLRKMQSAGTLPADRKIMLAKLLQLKVSLSEQCAQLEEEVGKMEEELSAIQRGRIKVKNTIYPGVKITIGSISKFVKDNTDFAIFYLDGADIKTSSYEA